jgi:hypothetical protein
MKIGAFQLHRCVLFSRPAIVCHPSEINQNISLILFLLPFTGDCPNFRGGEDLLLEKAAIGRENGTVPFGRRGTGTYFGVHAIYKKHDETCRKMSQSPAACERLHVIMSLQYFFLRAIRVSA